MKIVIRKLISLSLFIAILTVSPGILSAQNKRLAGELTVIKNTTSTNTEDYVTVDGQRALSGRSIMSPSEIVTSPQASAKISLGQTGNVLISPNSKVNLSFVNSSIAGELTTGEITVETLPNTTLNIFTRDGAITTPNRSQANTVKISIKNGETQVNTVAGQVMFNNVLVSTGETFPLRTNDRADSAASSHDGVNPLLIVGILGAVAGAVLIALTVSSGGNGTPTVSPTR